MLTVEDRLRLVIGNLVIENTALQVKVEELQQQLQDAAKVSAESKKE